MYRDGGQGGRGPAATLPPLPPAQLERRHALPQLMGLQDVQLPLQPAVEKAYEELINMPLEEGYRWVLHAPGAAAKPPMWLAWAAQPPTIPDASVGCNHLHMSIPLPALAASWPGWERKRSCLRRASACWACAGAPRCSAPPCRQALGRVVGAQLTGRSQLLGQGVAAPAPVSSGSGQQLCGGHLNASAEHLPAAFPLAGGAAAAAGRHGPAAPGEGCPVAGSSVAGSLTAMHSRARARSGPRLPFMVHSPI